MTTNCYDGLEQPSTLADALREVMNEALEAKEALG